MGQSKVRKRGTAEFVKEFPYCCLCGGLRAATTREHMPPRSLFPNKHRPDKLVMPACADCNKGTGSSDLVAAIISRWNASDTGLPSGDHAKLAAQAKRQIPELVKEWLTADTPLKQWEARLHLASQGLRLPNGVKFSLIGPKTIRQLNIFSHKVAFGFVLRTLSTPIN